MDATTYNENIVNAIINAIGDSEGEPLGLRAAAVIAAIEASAGGKLLMQITEADGMPSSGNPKITPPSTSRRR